MGERENERYIVAYEIGSSKVRGAVGIVDASGVVDVVATEEEKLIDKVRYGIIENSEVSDAIDAVTARLEAYPRVAPRTVRGGFMGLGGRSVMSSMVDVDLALPAETEITRQIINELVQKATATVDADRDVIDVVPVRFTVDGKTQVNPVGSYGNVLKARMTVVSCSQKLKRMLRRVVTDKAGIEIVGYVNRTLAEADMVLADDERRLGCMLVDFGAETTSVAIFKAGACIYQATLPMGSRNITIDLTRLNYTEQRAEEIKKLSGNALSQDSAQRKAMTADGVDYSEINNYVHARADEIVANIMAQLRYADVKEEDLPKGIIVIGGGARLRGFNDLLSQVSGMPVRQGAPSAQVRISDSSIHGTEAIDVIAILLEASKRPAEDCIEVPEIDTTTAETAVDDTAKDSGDSNIEGYTSRIGSLYDDDDDDTPKKKEKKKPKKNPFTGLINSLMGRMERMMDETEEAEGSDE
jgi:cell division protein ftsA